MRTWLLLLATACGPVSEDALLMVEVDGLMRVASIEVFDADDVDDPDPYFIQQDVPLPGTFSVPAGRYTLLAVQGTCSGSTDITLEARAEETVTLVMRCPE